MHRFLILGDEKIQWYVILCTIFFFPMLFFNLSQYKAKQSLPSVVSKRAQKYFLKKLKQKSRIRFLEKNEFWTVVEIFILTILQYFFSKYSTGFASAVFNTGANYFGCLFFYPFAMLLIYWLIGIDPLKQSDLTAPTIPLALIFIKLACFCEGCCNGIECREYGMYNHSTYSMEFPVQLVEAGWGLLLFALLFAIRKKVKPGTLFPLYAILYSATRFCSEFLRSEENILGPLKQYHLFCIAGFILGFIYYFIVIKYGDKISNFGSKGCFFFIENLKEKQKRKKKSRI